jgi:hypothetical protein
MFGTFTLAGWAVDEMDGRGGLSSLARTLATLPRSKAGPDVGNAALPFDLPDPLTPPVAQHDQWALLGNRLQAVIDQEDLIVTKYNDNDLMSVREKHKKELDQLKQLLANT